MNDHNTSSGCDLKEACSIGDRKLPRNNNMDGDDPFTMINLNHNTHSSLQFPGGSSSDQFKAGPCITQYSERIVEEILYAIFAERRGHFPETSSSCDIPKFEELKQRDSVSHVDKRLQYWHEMLQTRRKMQNRVEIETGKTPEQVLFNRSSTLDNRNKETVKRLMSYAERVKPANLAKKPVSALIEREDPCTCRLMEPVPETWPQPELRGEQNVEIIGLPAVVQEELLGSDAARYQLRSWNWMNSPVLDERIDEQFNDITKVVEFFPDLQQLQVKGISIDKLRPQPKVKKIGEESIHSVSTSTDKSCSGEDQMLCDDWTEPMITEFEAEPEPPELALKVNGKEYIVCEKPFTDCFEILTKFTCEPYQRRIKHVLRLQNIGKQTLSFRWSQGIYYYNRGSLLLAKDNEFFFDTDNFRLTPDQCYNLIVLYQPRKVSMAVELWRLQVEPRIFCGHHESMQLRFHGRCTPPKEYLARLRELHCKTICFANTVVMDELTGHLGDLVPLIEPPPACCPYERALDERETFNSLNPGYNCMRFDDLEVLKGMHKHLKKPREKPWDLRLETIKMLIMRIENTAEREKMFKNLMILQEPLLGAAPSLDMVSRIDEQKQRTRYIYVRGAICNCIEEWEDLVFIVEESFYKPELQRYYMHLLDEAEEEEEDNEYADPFAPKAEPDPTAKIKLIPDIDLTEMVFDEKVNAAVMKKLHRSKYFRDALYIQTYSHLCNIAEDIVSVIESSELVPT
ncbi:uncharacterized protein LOC116804156 [Drosophila mojavensis]|uniref:uncharacterized protein LOC116804156 n=1 Tax=Drosophila mojavensis TaxID=7230 RepID=UPI00017C9145|nr:uncharacterized protein LOC116804156 [Drosophila mojavensis]